MEENQKMTTGTFVVDCGVSGKYWMAMPVRP